MKAFGLSWVEVTGQVPVGAKQSKEALKLTSSEKQLVTKLRKLPEPDLAEVNQIIDIKLAKLG
ncbi:MAG: hypothetical protein AAF542_00050 [Pseudomonadota bacterium]